jgi:HEAT repeat protein
MALREWTLRFAAATGIAVGLCGVASPAAAGDPPPPPAKPPPAAPAAKTLSDDEPDLEGAEKERHEKQVKSILESLTKEKNQQIVRDTMQRLGSAPTRAGRDALMLYVVGNKNQEYVGAAFTELGKIGGKKAIEFLCGKSALKSGDFLVQQQAADVLAKAKSPLAVGPMLDVLTAPGTKIELVSSLAKAVAQTAPKDDRVIETMFQLADAVKDTIRANALEAMGYLKTDRAAEKLKEALVKDKNARCRGAAARGMKNTGRKELIPALEAAVKGEKSMQAIGEINDALAELSSK